MHHLVYSRRLQPKKGIEMPGQHDLTRHQIAVKFPHQVWRQIEKAAEASNSKTPGSYIRDVVTLAVGNIELTAEDAELIARRIREAEETGRMK